MTTAKVTFPPTGLAFKALAVIKVKNELIGAPKWRNQNSPVHRNEPGEDGRYRYPGSAFGNED